MEYRNMRSRKPRVVIIGAGISGLSAARRLTTPIKPGSSVPFDVTVLEASQRVGGRIHTNEFGSTGEQIELGATWIHGIEGSPIYEIAKQDRALEGDVPFECMDGFPDPPIYKAEGGLTVDNATALPIVALYKQLIAEVNERRGVEVSALEKFRGDNLGTFLRKGLEKHLMLQNIQSPPQPPENDSDWDVKSINEGVFAIQENWERCVCAAPSLHDLDLAAFSEYWEFPGEQITIAKGFSAVVHAMAKRLPPNTIRFSKKVQKICWTADVSGEGYPVKLHCNDGSVVEADHVIVTVSLGVLKAAAHSLFQPHLPAWKLDAIRKLGFGVVDKLFVLMEPLKDGAVHPNVHLLQRPKAQTSSSPAWIRKTHAAYPIHKKSNVLVSWFAGEEAKVMESLPDEEIARGFQTMLSNFGDDRKVAGLEASKTSDFNYSNGSSILHGRWSQNPLFLGSYSYVAVGSSGDDIDDLAEPVPMLVSGNVVPLQLLFAGEATHREQYSTTHGAYFSGLREAERLLKHYGFLE